MPSEKHRFSPCKFQELNVKCLKVYGFRAIFCFCKNKVKASSSRVRHQAGARLVRRCVADWHAINILPRRIQAAKKHTLRKVHCTIPLTIPTPVLRELKAQISQVPRQGDTSGQSSWLTRRRGKSGNRRTRRLAPSAGLHPARIEPRFPLEEGSVAAAAHLAPKRPSLPQRRAARTSRRMRCAGSKRAREQTSAGRRDVGHALSAGERMPPSYARGAIFHGGGFVY